MAEINVSQETGDDDLVSIHLAITSESLIVLSMFSRRKLFKSFRETLRARPIFSQSALIFVKRETASL